ncbi:SDR family NAD(P)-dependent oxidoreductase [Parasulfitobacter algicola]|uniref:SDR family oxidoreductase n=1 Tax=Parasulfitobacter algicola TaxID=2614809 RepID=A0ABX2IW85_9RHOB|nr:SDR family oxidoreductase [Sulfitobacter algicola]NSX55132.1 SDR family oxidoreductase [Sulfitobacter algicola]
MKHWTLITGASEGIGKEFARIAAKEGRSVILAARSEDKLNQLAEDLRSNTVQVEVIPADLSRIEDTAALWDRATADGRIVDVLVNNAGLGRNGVFGDGTDWDRELLSIQVNMTALTYLMKKAIPHMQNNGGGRILNVASTAAFMPGPNMAVYHATKAYVLSLSEAVAEELRGSKVTITALCPGATQSNFFNEADMHDVTLVNMGKLPTARSVAELGWIGMRGGKRIVVTGFQNKVFAFLPRISPRSFVTRIAKYFLSKGS